MSRRRLASLALALLLGPWLLLALLAAATPLPPELRADAAFDGSTRVLDREGRLLRHARAGDGTWSQRARLDELGERVPAALLAAEDRRFYWHPGVDPVAIARAAGQLLWHRRVVSGASTLTQQLARTLVPRPRTVAGKIREMALALRIEASLSKRQILEEYLSRVAFGPTVRGVEAASRSLFDRPARELSLAEAALLAGLPQSPTHHDPRASEARARRRRDAILRRMEAARLARPDEVALALRQPITLTRWRPAPLAPHFLEATLGPALGPPLPSPPAELTTTLDASLQRKAEEAARRAVEQLAARNVSAASVVVLDNDTGEILAYVGSPDASDARRLGANDGVRARRQPGSALKPFVYALAVERLGWTAATLLPDVEISFPTPGGPFVPRDYDGRFHGPLRLREALANSRNVPAVWTASRLGPEAVLDRLLALGFRSLDQPAEHYGVAIALGDGEVTLLELASAYAALARGGRPLSPRAWRSARLHSGALFTPADLAPTADADPARVMDAQAAALIADVLSDPQARLAAFGAQSALDFPFPVAAKTGTSKGFRDNIAAGFTREVTVAAWVGNFDGRPMRDVSGISGAGPLFHDVLLAAMEQRSPAPLSDPSFEVQRICPLSGALAGPDCPHERDERFLPGHAPAERCAIHRRLPVDTRTRMLAGKACPAADVREQLFEVYPASYQGWALAAGRPQPPGPSPRCPDGAPVPDDPEAPRIAWPPDGTVLLLDRQLTARQELTVRVEAPGARSVELLIDSERHALQGPPFALRWPLRPGNHRLRALDGVHASDAVWVRVDE